MMAGSGDEAVANARRFDTYAVGYCLRFVRAEAWQIGGLYGSAIDAWHGARHRHPGDRHPPIGAPMFYAGGRYGHIVVATSQTRSQMRSTDCRTRGAVSETDVDWPVRTWGSTYLGWTEDLNGVTLPLGEEDEEMTPEDWIKLRAIVREEVVANNPTATDSVWNEEQNVTHPDGTKQSKTTRQILRETWQRVAKLD